jgi:aldose sugar dehydrogenase
MKKYTILGIFGIAFLGMMCSFGLKEDSKTNSDIDVATVDGTPKADYKKYCASCHGDELRTFIDRKWKYGNSWNEVFNSIKNGNEDDGMPAYKDALSDAQIRELTDYILKGIEEKTSDDFNKTTSLAGWIESEEQKFRLDTVVTGLSVPWGIAFLPDGTMLITERDGQLFSFKKDKLTAITGVPTVKAQGQGGLLDVEVHPNFKENQYIYLSYSKPDESGDKATTAVMRAKLKDNQLTNQEVIFEALPYFSTRHHYGSRLEFDKNGYLFITVGDRGKQDENPQSLDNHCGKIHRIHEDGKIPTDNPFYNDANAKKTIYSYGHRNPQGMSLHPQTGVIWAHEHGPRGGDEVNLIQKGENYGWPVISYGINYIGTKFTELTEHDKMLQPKKYWVPSIAPCGMTFVSGGKYPNWENDILTGSLRFNFISRLKMNGNEVMKEEVLLNGIGRMRAIEMGNDGLIYIATENPGYIIRLLPE